MKLTISSDALKSGVRQLVRDIEILYNANQMERNKLIDFNCQTYFLEATVIYPVLVVDEGVFNFELLQSKLIKWFDDEIISKKFNISTQVTVKPLLILTISLLEDLEPYLENDDFTLFDFAEFYADEVINRAASLRYASVTALNAFSETRGIKYRQNNRMYKIFEDFMNDMGDKFKIKTEPLN